MRSPFPGMDPYLEGSLWTSIHSQLGVEIQRQLVPRLRPRYIALTNERFVIATADPQMREETADIYPDVSIAEGAARVPAGESAALVAPLRVATVMPESIPHISVESGCGRTPAGYGYRNSFADQ